jgi:hypothetical protein
MIENVAERADNSPRPHPPFRRTVMHLNAIRIRAALLIAGALTAVMFFALGGHLGPRPVVQIEFGSYPEVFQGMTVEIDGKPAGTLKPSGAAHRSEFTVKPGRHTIRVVHPLYVSIERRVDVRAGGSPVVLVLDLQAGVNDHGQSQTAIAFAN